MSSQQDDHRQEDQLDDNAFGSGKHCSKPDCRTLDFLPLRCSQCHLVFCGPHAPVFYHDCPVVAEPVSRPDHRPAGTSTIDPVQELVSSHTPPILPRQDDSRHAKARQILASRFPPPKERQPARSAKELSPALKLMLLKRKAVSGDPRKKDRDVPSECRWHGSLGLLSALRNQAQDLTWDEQLKNAPEPRAVWFDKKTVTGKVFDLTIERFRSQLVANSLSCLPSELQLLVFHSGSQTPVVITDHCSKPWGEVVQEGEDVWLACRKSNSP